MARLQTGQPWIVFWKGQEAFLFSKIFRTTLCLTKPPIPWAPDPFRGIKKPCCEDDHSLPSSAETQNGGAYLLFPCIPSCYAKGHI